MDFDTAIKRWSGLAWAGGLRLAPIPDGAFEAADRQTLLGRYAGISWGAAVDDVEGGPGRFFKDQREEDDELETEMAMVLDLITVLVAAEII